MYDQTDNGVLIVTDTLVVDANDQPAFFAHKVWAFPTLNLVIALTGAATVGDALNHYLSTMHGPRDVEELDALAPDLLRLIDGDLRTRLGDIGVACVYVFGFPSGSDQLVRYTYSSRNNYESERDSGAATFVKPKPTAFDPDVPTTGQELIELAVKVRHESDTGVCPHPVPIGGDLFLTDFRTGLFGTQHLYRFPDYEEHLALMNGGAAQ